jgi:phenylpropionate dioxygenase-like ring-hydroxylating dioxygenase large terminal subunit
MFLHNAWYVAAWDHEIGRTLTPVRMLDQALVLYRTQAGGVAALEDACPHRKLPLSMGRRQGDAVECGYHGLTFDRSGTCLRVPGAERVPHRAQVRAYPVEERYGLVWLWMGDPALADPGRIFEVEHWGDPAWGVNAGDAMEVACNYLYLTDNLLDPSHVAWVHPTSFGNAACEDDAAGGDGVRGRRDRLALDEGGRARAVLQAVPAVRGALRPQAALRGAHAQPRDHPRDLLSGRYRRRGPAAGPAAFVMDSYNFMTPVRRHPHPVFLVPDAQRGPERSRGVGAFRHVGARRLRGRPCGAGSGAEGHGHAADTQSRPRHRPWSPAVP